MIPIQSGTAWLRAEHKAAEPQILFNTLFQHDLDSHSRARIAAIAAMSKLSAGRNSMAMANQKDSCRSRGKQMSQLFFLRLQIFLGIRAGFHFAGHAFHHLEPGALQSFDLIGIVRKQPHLLYP